MAAYYVNIYDANRVCGDDYVCYDIYWGYYCCNYWYSKGWAIAMFVILGLIVLGLLVWGLIACCMNKKQQKEHAEMLKNQPPVVEMQPQPVTTVVVQGQPAPVQGAPVDSV